MKTMETYFKEFDQILDPQYQQPPYDQEAYKNYTLINKSRYSRWFKKGVLSESLQNQIKAISKPQKWVLITAHWCGDAANIQPWIAQMLALNPLISVEVQIRDEKSEIEQYLTQGKRGIPKLIIRDENQEDLAVWGPRPQAAQSLYEALKADESLSGQEKQVALQKWYLQDKGKTFQAEMSQILHQLG